MFRLACKYFGYRYRQYRRKTSEKIVVETVYGPVRGVKRISCWDDSYYSFEKIPFAKPPVGELRFTVKHAPLRPVMVWIYGGGFESGGATKLIYSPEYFMHKDVVFVTFNYRVGAIGFLSLKDPTLKVPGNAGLKDQVMALKWIKKNIEKFGGDPENITIFGESAGGASVHYLTLTQQTKGLFHKAILMSGSTFCSWSLVPDHDWAYRLAKELGYTDEHNDAKILSFLQKANGTAICKANGRLLNDEERRNRLFFAHGPCIEPYVSEQCIVSKEPRLMARETWSNEIPVIIGGNSFEGLLLYADVKKNPIVLKHIEDCEYLVPLELGLDRKSDECNQLGLRLRKEHFRDEEPTMFSYLDDPVPPDPWVEPKKCEREPPMPTQFNMVLRVVHGTENCLFLNVYTPEIKPSELKPVMVWIYGGGFEMGGANRMMYGPDYLIQKDVILVTINYRVGPQGFLSLKDPKLKVPGNAGLKDQILALKWVNANIKNFGGDPGNVTLFGESAGGASTHYLMLTEQTKGLFHKAILMSGCALSPWACNTSSDNNFAYRLAKKLGYREENNDEKVLNFLRKRRGSHLAGVRLLTKEEKRQGVLFAHGPVVEPYITEQCVVPKDPLLMAREAWSNEIPVIMGGCSNEGYVFHIVAKKLNIKKEVGDCRALVPKFPTEVKNEDFQHDHLILKHLYFGSKEPTLFPLLEEPQAPEAWTDIIDCTSEASMAVQVMFTSNKTTGSEDCLYLSVFTKEVNPSKPKPVMVWVHGGGYIGGGTSKDMYSPDYLMSKDVVVVSLAYRVGAFGFLSFKDPTLKVPGNAGLKDQVLGLKWIQKNIGKFGGDPGNVTVFGESAGGGSVHFLMLTEQTKGLIHKAISMSGTTLCPWSMPPQRDWPYRIAKQMGYNGEQDDIAVLTFLKTADCYKLALAEKNVTTKEEKSEGILWSMGPTIEPYVTEQCVVPKDPRLMARDTWSNSIPIMIGGTSSEGIFMMSVDEENLRRDWEKDSTHMLPIELQSDGKNDLSLELGNRLRKEFFGDGAIDVEPFLDISSYKQFWHGIHRTVLGRLKYAKASTYYYLFDFDSPDFSLLRNMGLSKGVQGVAHGDDLGFLFLNLFISESKPDSAEYKTIKRMVEMWTEFATKGDPNCDDIKPAVWKPIDVADNPSKMLNISNEITFIDNPLAGKLRVWDSLYGQDELI